MRFKTKTAAIGLGVAVCLSGAIMPAAHASTSHKVEIWINRTDIDRVLVRSQHEGNVCVPVVRNKNSGGGWVSLGNTLTWSDQTYTFQAWTLAYPRPTNECGSGSYYLHDSWTGSPANVTTSNWWVSHANGN
jgi:hypothetical protein